jgi:plasmid stabilization system protein ParE
VKYRIHPAAELEAEEAADWYGERSPALAVEFARQYAQVIDVIVEKPRMYGLADDAPPGVECRNALRLGRFPFRIVYALPSDDEIYVVAVAHHNRRPAYWQDRLPTPPQPGS